MFPLFLPKGMAPDEENEKEDVKNTEDHFNGVIYHFLLCCLQNVGQNVLPGWMGLRQLGHSWVLLLLSAPLPCSFRSNQPSQPLRCCVGHLGTCLLHSWARNGVSHAALRQLAVSDLPLGPCC